MKNSGLLSKITHTIHPAIYVIGVAAAIRLYASYFTHIINPDGVVYIYQAKAIYAGVWSVGQIGDIGHVSNYPFLIVAFYTVVGNWVLAAKSVSFVFGTLTLLPLYLLCRHLFDRDTSLLCLLVYACIPFFVDAGADVVRGPVFWFWLTLGLLFFVVQHNTDKYHIYTVLCGLAFLMAAWARIEAIVYYAFSAFFLVLVGPSRVKKILLINVPLIILLLGMLLMNAHYDLDLSMYLRISEIPERLFAVTNKYETLRSSLTEMSHSAGEYGDLTALFLEKARNCIPIVALWTITNHFLEAFFLPYCLFVFIGIVIALKKARGKEIYLYFIAICMLSVFIVFVHLLKTWNIDNRFLATVILPCFVFTCLGIEWVLKFLSRLLGWRASVLFSIVFLYILAFGLGKNLQERYADKTVFKEIGEFVSERENTSESIGVVSSFDFVRWFVFYSNLRQEGSEIPEIYDVRPIMNDKPELFLRLIRKRKIKYLLVDERHWAKRSREYFENYKEYNLVRLNEWHHQDTGKMVLFEVL